MTTKAKELRQKIGFTLPCPVCGSECWPDNVTKPQSRKVQIATDVLVLPKRSLVLPCGNCGLDLWVTLDDDGNPISL